MYSRKIFSAFFILSALAFNLLEGATIKTFHLQGTIGTHVNMTVQGLDGSDTKILFNDVTINDFDTGYIEIQDAIQLRNIHSNAPIFLKIQNNGWTLPPSYDANNGPKKTDGSDSQFMIQIDTGSLSVASGTLTAEGTYGTQMNAVTNTAGQFLKVGTIGGGAAHQGAHNGSVDINARVMLDPAFDIAGTYSVELELTWTSQI